MPSTGYLQLAIVYVVWGTVYPVIRIALTEASAPTPMQLQTVRLLLSAAILAAPPLLRGRFVVRHRRDLVLCVVSGVLFWVTGNGFATFALRRLPAGFVTMAAAAIPLWTAVFQSLLDRDGIARRHVASLVFGFLGISLVFFPAVSSMAPADLWHPVELGLMVLAPLTWAIGSLLQRPLRATVAPDVAASVQLAVGGCCWLGLAVADGSPLPVRLSATGIAAIAYLSVVVGAFGFSSYVQVTRLLPPHVGATFAYVNPVISLLLAWLFLGESTPMVSLIGMVMVIGSVIVLLWDDQQARGPRR